MTSTLRVPSPSRRRFGPERTAPLPPRCIACLLTLFALFSSSSSVCGQALLPETVAMVQPRMVKISGAGGAGRLEAYQSGFLVSDDGYIVTARSYVLDVSDASIVLHDGSRYNATYVGHDPLLDMALLKIDAVGLSHFRLDDAVELETGDRILAFSNLYGIAVGREATSVMQGIVAAVTELSARQGSIQLPYQGQVYIVDTITNNPGAAGGALTDSRGRLCAMIGKETQDAENGLWLNYGLPISAIAKSVADIRAGKLIPRARAEDQRAVSEPMTIEQLGIVLVPNVLPNTPPFVDRVVPRSPAETAGLRADDLILFIDDRLMASRAVVLTELRFIHRDDQVEFTIQRGNDILTLTIEPQVQR